jgi:glycosyltransferase involved in cell wall biosynthesis
VEEGVTGRKFTATKADELARAVDSMLADGPSLRQMRANARTYFEANLTEQQNFTQLMRIYSTVLAASQREYR